MTLRRKYSLSPIFLTSRRKVVRSGVGMLLTWVRKFVGASCVWLACLNRLEEHGWTYSIHVRRRAARAAGNVYVGMDLADLLAHSLMRSMHRRAAEADHAICLEVLCGNRGDLDCLLLAL